MNSDSHNNFDVSVLLCTYNGMPFLPEAVESILLESSVNWQLVIVNDGSTDSTMEYLQNIDNQKVKVIHLNENTGIGRAANTGLMHCDSALVARLDSDDVMIQGRLAAQVKYLNSHPEIDVVATQADLTKTDFNQEGYQHYVRWSNQWKSNREMRGNRFRDSPIINPTVCFRKEVVINSGGYAEEGPEDYELWLRLWSEGIRMHKLEMCGVLWRDHSKRLTRTHSNYSGEWFTRIKLKYLKLEWEGSGESRPVYIWGKSRNARDWFTQLSQIGIPVHGFIDFEEGEWKGLPVINNESALEIDCFIFIAVGDRKGTEQIQDALNERERVAEEDYYFL